MRNYEIFSKDIELIFMERNVQLENNQASDISIRSTSNDFHYQKKMLDMVIEIINEHFKKNLSM
jgi:hypothetical protein